MKKLKTLFWTIWTISLSFGLIEATIGSGYVLEKLGFSMKIVFMAIALMAMVLLLFKFVKKDIGLQKSDKIITTFSVFIVSIYIVIKVINRMTHEGFVFSKLHILPDGLLWPALISLLSIAVVWIPRVKFKKLLNIQSAIFVFAFLIITQNLFSIYKSKWQTLQFMLSHPSASYDDKMRKAIGDIIYNYALFVDKYTPKDASILVPPQAFPWPGSGNVGYFRYFIYPRTIASGEEFEPPSKDALASIDYILLNWGETDTVESPHTHDWPKFDIRAEKIIFMNRDGSFGGEVNGNYYYKDYKDKKVWGLIEVKH